MGESTPGSLKRMHFVPDKSRCSPSPQKGVPPVPGVTTGVAIGWGVMVGLGVGVQSAQGGFGGSEGSGLVGGVGGLGICRIDGGEGGLFLEIFMVSITFAEELFKKIPKNKNPVKIKMRDNFIFIFLLISFLPF